MKYLKIDGHQFYYMMVNACNKLEEQKEFVNSLNVFPVPDGDTGTNMSMTFKSAVKEIEELQKNSIGEISNKLAKGALMGARGNSGVILSQILRGISNGLEGKDSVNAVQFSNCILEGSNSAYKAVMRPTEGTILTIIRAAGECAVKSENENIEELMKEVCEHSEDVLNKTPEMLPVLKEAKVVDAGGMGLLIMLKGMYEALRDDLKPQLIKDLGDIDDNNAGFISEIQSEDIKFGYCTEFLILTNEIDIDEFKSDLKLLGDSMMVVYVDDIVKVHIHTNDPGTVLSKATKLGELSKIKIDNMREEHRHLVITQEEKSDETISEDIEDIDDMKKYGFISVAIGKGLVDIFKDLGSDIVIEGGQTMNPSTQDIVNSINDLNAENIFILPNNKNIIMAANQAVEITDKNVIVLPTKTIPQGIASIAMFNPSASIEDNIEEMNESIKSVATGSVTYAVRDTEINGKQISKGDILGLIEDDVYIVGNNIYTICKEIICKLINEDSEITTVFYSDKCDKDQVDNLANFLEQNYSDMDIQCYNGSQPLYYFIISVE